ncbi:flagellar motor protein MotB [Tropicimonas sp. IMCC6043]|uniref:flagellar motor protein MotB n=1 Tax=Tropicimonas sp. IMCC6043 TaxID=2510645 RepID=UPI00101D6554|nr:flagellar motor protein MotB [Tropicimonas sp. IMCC6043]RYH09995.1 chemotaxis protein MotB [Tropicimonas sp. IMCC6043]
MSVGSNAPVIIKRKKVISGDAHHGGAWKVAYADFVTAMMAFFMLMWLLNATTEKQRKGIADYFSPTIPLNRVSGGGDGSLGGDSVFTEDTLAQNGIGASSRYLAQKQAGSIGAVAAREQTELLGIEEMLLGSGGESMAMQNAMRHVVTRLTDEGLIVELFALEGVPLFDAGGADPTPLLEMLLDMVGRVFSLATNDVAIKGFSRSHAIVLAENPAWDHSMSRAERARRMLGATIDPGRIERVAGFADRHPAVANPMSMRNDRLEIVLLRTDLPDE